MWPQNKIHGHKHGHIHLLHARKPEKIFVMIRNLFHTVDHIFWPNGVLNTQCQDPNNLKIFFWETNWSSHKSTGMNFRYHMDNNRVATRTRAQTSGSLGRFSTLLILETHLRMTKNTCNTSYHDDDYTRKI